MERNYSFKVIRAFIASITCFHTAVPTPAHVAFIKFLHL